MTQHNRGFVLVNALVLVAALAAVAVLLLARADQGRSRLGHSRAAAQLTLNLDAFEAFARLSLEAAADGGPDHLGRPWARPLPEMPLDQGATSGRIADQQGLFNVNWLTDPDHTPAQIAFDRLAQGLGVSDQDVATLRALLRPGGPPDTGAFARLDPPEDPVGGALLMISQLDRMPGLSPRGRALLRPYLTALPGDSKLNPNTADPRVLAAFLPDLSPADLAGLIARRQQRPFVSVELFLQEVGLARPEDTPEPEPDQDPTRLAAQHLSVQSDWFEATITATLNADQARRRVMLLRQGVPAVVRPVWRQTTRP